MRPSEIVDSPPSPPAEDSGENSTYQSNLKIVEGGTGLAQTGDVRRHVIGGVVAGRLLVGEVRRLALLEAVVHLDVRVHSHLE